MDNPSWWNIVAAISAGVVGPIGLVSTLAVWYVKITVDSSIDRANTKQLEKIQGAFIPAMSSNITGKEIERLMADVRLDLAVMRKDVAEIDASRIRHNLANEMQIDILAREVERLKSILPRV